MPSQPLSRLIWTLCLATAIGIGGLGPAHAKRGFGGAWTQREEVLRPVAQLDAQTELCHLLEIRSLFGVLGLWSTSKGYVIGAPTCAGDGYYTLSAPVAELKAQGALPADLPEAPALSPRDMAEGFGLWGALALLLLVAGIRKGLAGRKRKIRLDILALEDGPAFRMIDVMCHAAIADGRIDPAEVAYIRQVAREMTGLDYSDDHIRETIARADKLKHPKDMVPFAKGLTQSQRHLILQAALSVVAADGDMDKRETRFIGLLVAGFGLARDDLDQAMRILATRRAAAVPA